MLGTAAMAGFLGLILVQFWLLFTDFMLPLNSRIRTVRTLPAVERGAYIGFGDEFAGNIRFLWSQVPEDARIVLPPLEISSTYGNQGIMQFFLFPRSIVNCPQVKEASACLQTFRGPETYFLSVFGFPNNETAVDNRDLIMFDESFGVYLPYKPPVGSDSGLK